MFSCIVSGDAYCRRTMRPYRVNYIHAASLPIAEELQQAACLFFITIACFYKICMRQQTIRGGVDLLISLRINRQRIVAHSTTVNNTKRRRAKTNYRNGATTRRIGKLLLFKKIYLFVSRDERAYGASAGDQSRAGGFPPPPHRPMAARANAARAVSFFKSFALDFHPISRLCSLSYGR